jgi:AraC-like DNA-binding protein
LNDQQIAALSVKLNGLMNVEKIYLENELDLPAVAERLGISVHDASYLINKISGDNFYNFINQYRIQEAKRLLISPEGKKLNMLGIAYEAGFNSKTAFNTAFKKWVGISPSEYVKQQKNSWKDVRLDNSERYKAP